MTGNTKNIVLINASPKVNEASVSGILTEFAENQMKTNGIHTEHIAVRESISRKQTEHDFEIMQKADTLVIAFPLYIFCLPGILMRFLQDYVSYCKQHEITARDVKVYAVVNCGFPEPDINEDAVHVIKSFSEKIGASFRFGVMIGGGGMLLGAKDAPFMKKTMGSLNNAFEKIAKEVQGESYPETENISISMNVPRKFYLFMGGRGWVHSAKKNGLTKKDLYRKPYRPD